METLDSFLPNVTTQDTRKRIQAHQDLVPYLSDPHSSLTCPEMDEFIGGLVGWVNCSNYKISMNGLEILCLMVDRMGEDFKIHVSSVLPAVVDRLGDAKDQVREMAQQLLLKIMMPATSPQFVFDRIQGSFTHKLWRVRDEVLICLQNTVNTYGARSLQLSKIVPSICKLLDDQNSQVRETAIMTLAEVYRHVGERVRQDLAKKGIAPQRLNQIYAKFDEVKHSGGMLATADFAPSHRSDDDVDFAKPLSTKVPQAKRASSASSASSSVGARKSLLPTNRSSSASTSLKRRRSIAGPPTSGQSGGVDEELFTKSFEDVPKVQIFSSRDVQDQLSKIQTILSDTNSIWEKRCEAVKSIRSVIVAGGMEYDDFQQSMRSLDVSLITSVKDLRSQIVRETCITLAYLSQRMGSRFEHLAEVLLPHLINLIPNSAKVMASSGVTCIYFIIQYTQSSRLIPILISNLSSKSNIIRRHCFEFLNVALQNWNTHYLEKHIAGLQDAIKRGISDADSEARVFARKCFWGFAEHFKEQADMLMNALEPRDQKLLNDQCSGSSSNSVSSDYAGKSRPRSASQDRSTGFDSSTLGRIGKKKHSNFSSARSDTGAEIRSRSLKFSKDVDVSGAARHHGADLDKTLSKSVKDRIIRSSSAVDLANGMSPSYSSYASPKRRSPQMAAASRMMPGATYSLPRHRSSSTHQNLGTLDRNSRARNKNGSSQSQPNSRSSSPTSRISYLTHTQKDPMTPRSMRRSGAARSQGASREGSPNRVHMQPGRERRLSGGKTLPTSAGRRKAGVLAQRTLRPGQDVEEALTDALRTQNRRRYEYDSDDAASETSSVCSERSYRSIGQTSESTSKDSICSPPTVESVKTPKDTTEIIALLGSGSHGDRKEGLIALQNLLRNGRFLSRVELQKVCEVFNRMFHDPHSKVLSLFLDTLVDLIQVHSQDLTNQMFPFLTRLLNKSGQDLLGSVQNRVQRALDAVRENFPAEQQFSALSKYIVDQTQSASLKVKASLLNYMHNLVLVMNDTDFVNSADTRLVLSRIINFTTEPKSVEVRKAAQLVLIDLFNLNAPELSMMLTNLPKPFQDSATKILQTHMRSASRESRDSTSDVLSPKNVTPQQNRSRPPSRGHHDEMETENMNPEDIYNSIKQTTADIQNLSFHSKLESYDPVKKKREFTSQDSGIQDLRNDSPDAVDSRKGNYNPSQYSDEAMNGYNNRSRLADAELDDSELFNEDPWKAILGFSCSEHDESTDNDVITTILTELSNHNKRNNERKDAMLSLIKMTREGNFNFWDEHFKTILFVLLETLGDTNGHIRALALRVLREILKNQPSRFKDYTELTILRILEAHKDTEREVVRSAEECADTLANYLPPETCVRILNPIISTANYPVSLAAIKMQNKVLELLPKDTLEAQMAEIIPGLLRGYDDQQSTVRKSAVFCLVAIYLKVGEGIWNHLTKLNYSKVKLLNLYIKRAQQSSSGTSASSLDT
ncbi:CLIP-associating protein 1-like isoform X1 [Crassostrea angulata]|uniref:CLIP-associating protein 1-like isoform X1 n=1 Tax=Magallana angulata TaxID=2784310 RepID=UPI0022B10421|nr:CLIP-associating protein 1-like isoform X1 [Crassostrea angulata]